MRPNASICRRSQSSPHLIDHPALTLAVERAGGPVKKEPELLDLNTIRRQVPGRPSKIAIWRWCRHGILSRSGKRVRLEHRRIGGVLFTTESWLAAFFEALTRDDLAALDRRKKASSEDVSA